MCVILAAEQSRLTELEVNRAMASNPHGNGIAWVEGGTVHYRKGLAPATVRKLVATLPLPYVFHARIATVGGINRRLCHPFPITSGTGAVPMKGRAKRGVLFHNGHWGAWTDYLVPSGPGPWSDSRAMATLVARFDLESVAVELGEFQRVAVLRPDGVERVGTGWNQYASGRWASNRAWSMGVSCDPLARTGFNFKASAAVCA